MNRSQIRNIILVVLALVLLASSRAIASLTIEYNWWSALGQFETWLRMLLYKVLPAAAVSLIALAGTAVGARPRDRFRRGAGGALLVVLEIDSGGAFGHRHRFRWDVGQSLDRDGLRRLAWN